MERRQRRSCRDAFERRDHEEAVRLLPLQDPEVLYWYESGLLFISISNGWLDLTRDLITNYHFNPHKYYYCGSCLCSAAKGNHVDIVEYLIKECGCDPMMTTTSCYGSVPVLHYVASEGLLDVLNCMVMNINGHIMDEQYHDTNGRTVLHCAVKHIYVIKYLINECNCHIMVTDKDGRTPLHLAVEHIDVVKYLINECNCDIMVTDKDGRTPLHLAVEHIDVVKYLINECNCDIMVTDKYGQTPLHLAVEHIDVVKYLINECNCDIMVTDKNGQTPLHHAARWGKPEDIEYFLSTGNCDPLAKDNKGRTPLQLAKEGIYYGFIIAIFKKFGNIKISYPIDSYVNVLLVGNPGAGKSTLSHVINDTASFTLLGSFRNVGGVVPCTAGIIPYKLQHRTLGNIILHDFAGHSEYYSSHSAVIENLLQGSGGVFLIVVNIMEKEAVKQLHQWLTVVRNEAQKALNECHVIVIVSHVDEISNPFERKRRKEEIEEIIVRERCDSVFLDCRKLGGNGVESFFKKLSSACESIRSTSGRNKFSLYHHEIYRLLEERKENILTLSDVMSAGKDNNDYVTPDKKEDVLDVLHSLHSTGLISVLKSEDKVWVVVNKGILLTEVDGILFAPKTFKEHVDIASNTGIVSVSGLTRLFPKYDPDMLICFLKNMELCQEMNPSFLKMTNLHQLAVEEEEEGGTERRGERLLFFPCLLSTDRPDEMTSQVYQFGWCLQCTSKHHFFPPRYFHVLSLHLAYKMAQPQEDDKLNRRCTFWSNSLYWSNGHGVGSLVEIVDESQCVLVMMSFKQHVMMSVGRDVIGEVMSVYKESCPSLEVKELVINPKELAYPVNTPRERTVYSVKDILSAIDKRERYLVHDNGTSAELKKILPDESLSDISNLSLLGGRDIKVRINTHKLFDTLIQALIIKRS